VLVEELNSVIAKTRMQGFQLSGFGGVGANFENAVLA
jgi:hypothetical protein